MPSVLIIVRYRRIFNALCVVGAPAHPLDRVDHNNNLVLPPFASKTVTNVTLRVIVLIFSPMDALSPPRSLFLSFPFWFAICESTEMKRELARRSSSLSFAVYLSRRTVCTSLFTLFAVCVRIQKKTGKEHKNFTLFWEKVKTTVLQNRRTDNFSGRSFRKQWIC